MNRITWSVPAMYADHHVLRVREALLKLGGVQEVIASAGRKKVSVTDDENTVSPTELQAALVAAGYVPDQASTLVSLPKPSEDGSAWYTVLHRVTKTEMKDREMSGDFRRY